MSRALQRRILEIVRTDSTFERATHGEREAWVGKCIFCNAHLYVAEDGTPISQVTIEHMLPRSHGGTDDLRNLALACARCNHAKGRHHDTRRRGDPRLKEIVDALVEKRNQRWRDPE